MGNWATSATTVRGARRILNECRRNHEYVVRNGEAAWVRAATARRVAAAERRLEELIHAEANGN